MILADWGADPKKRAIFDFIFSRMTYFIFALIFSIHCSIMKRSLTHVSMTTKFQKYIKNMIMQTQAANMSGFRAPPPDWGFGEVLLASVKL